MPIAVSDAVERLVKNRATLQTMSPLSESASDLSVETAYRIQRALESKLEENGGRVATAAAAEVLGNPLNSLAWLANALGGQGGRLRAGDIVMTGSISKVFRPKAGDSARATFTRLGSVSCRFV
jgi:2-keto-4-pentenoate hydratase